jgi:hypothetical protein
MILDVDQAFEIGVGIGLFAVWLAYLLMNIQIQQLASIHPTEPRVVMKISSHVQAIFITGDIFFLLSGLGMLYRVKASVSESMKLRWTALFGGLLASFHLPIFIRAWIFRASDTSMQGLGDTKVAMQIEQLKPRTELLGSGIATAASTAFCVTVTLMGLWSVEFFPSLRYSETLQRTSKYLLIAAVACGEFFFIGSLVEFQYHMTVITGIVLLVLSLLLGIAGYVPARYYTLFQDELEEEIPFFT